MSLVSANVFLFALFLVQIFFSKNVSEKCQLVCDNDDKEKIHGKLSAGVSQKIIGDFSNGKYCTFVEKISNPLATHQSLLE